MSVPNNKPCQCRIINHVSAETLATDQMIVSENRCSLKPIKMYSNISQSHRYMSQNAIYYKYQVIRLYYKMCL